MDQKRLATAFAALSIAMVSMAGAGCSSRESGSNVKNDAVSREEKVLDAAVVRPMTLVSSAIGAFGWVVTLPFTLPSGSAGETAKSWVGDPLKYTFCRPIGDMEDNSDKSCFGDGS